VRGFRIDVDDGRKHAICLDLPLDDGTDMGPSALELTLMSYVGCYATIFALTAKKMRITLEDLEVKSEAIKSEEVGTITQVRIDIMVATTALEDRIKRAHELTLKTCPVGILFEKASVKMEYRLRVEK
jgi:putative redox protein